MGISKSRVSKILNLNDLGLRDVPEEDRESVKQDVLEFVIDAILEDTSNGRSAVSGRKWKGLSKDYRDAKRSISSDATANLEATGDMLDALEGSTRSNGIEIFIDDPDEAIKAFAHIRGKGKLPKRQFIPEASQGFRKGITDEIRDMIREASEE